MEYQMDDQLNPGVSPEACKNSSRNPTQDWKFIKGVIQEVGYL